MIIAAKPHYAMKKWKQINKLWQKIFHSRPSRAQWLNPFSNDSVLKKNSNFTKMGFSSNFHRTTFIEKVLKFKRIDQNQSAWPQKIPFLIHFLIVKKIKGCSEKYCWKLSNIKRKQNWFNDFFVACWEIRDHWFKLKTHRPIPWKL